MRRHFCEYDITSLVIVWFSGDSANPHQIPTQSKTTSDDHIAVLADSNNQHNNTVYFQFGAHVLKS